MGSVSSLQQQDADLIPCLAQWVQGSRHSCGIGGNCSSDLIPAGEVCMPRGGQKRKEKKREEKRKQIPLSPSEPHLPGLLRSEKVGRERNGIYCFPLDDALHTQC